MNFAVSVLGALAHEARLEVFRVLARVSPDGVPAGDLAARLGIAAPTLSFHLQKLSSVGLIESERIGRTLLYSLRRDRLRELLWFIGEDCCQGRTELCCDVGERIEARLHDAEAGDGRERVLFVCTRNAARSQMAEAILRQEAGDRFEAFSGGVQPGEVHPRTIEVLDAIGADTRSLHAKDLGELLGKHSFSTAIVLCDEAYESCPRMRPFAPELLYWPFPDPVTEDTASSFEAVRDAIRARIQEWTAERGAATGARTG